MLKISYKPLWHILLDRGMTKNELREKIKVSTSTMAKLGKGERVSTDMLVRICEALDCDLPDIMELVTEDGTPVREVAR